MESRTLSGTDLSVSRICLGTMTFGGQADRAMAARILDCAFDNGVNFFDTANIYTNGQSETILGELLGARRKSIVLASKVGMKVPDETPGLSKAAILAAVEKSLTRLKTDYLDVYYFHAPDYTVPMEESLEAMNSLVQSGKVRYAAHSNYAAWQVCRLMQIAEQRGFAVPRISQPMYNVIARRIEPEYLPMCKEMGVSTVVYNPLAGGLLTNKHHDATPLPGTRFDGNRMYLDRYWNDMNREAVQRLADAAQASGRSIISLSLNWLLHHSAADFVILGASKVEHLESNLAACEEGALPPEALSVCDEVWSMLKGAAPKYNR